MPRFEPKTKEQRIARVLFAEHGLKRSEIAVVLDVHTSSIESWTCDLQAPKKRCPPCQQTFQPIRTDQIFCSESCRARDAYLRKRKRFYPHRHCDECDRKFQPRTYQQRFCGAKCRHRQLNRDHRRRKRGRESANTAVSLALE